MGPEITNQLDFESGISWQISDTHDGFRHRLIYQDKSGKVVQEGQWTSYEGTATLLVKDKHYACVTYYYDTVYPVETPFLVSPLTTV